MCIRDRSTQSTGPFLGFAWALGFADLMRLSILVLLALAAHATKELDGLSRTGFKSRFLRRLDGKSLDPPTPLLEGDETPPPPPYWYGPYQIDQPDQWTRTWRHFSSTHPRTRGTQLKHPPWSGAQRAMDFYLAAHPGYSSTAGIALGKETAVRAPHTLHTNISIVGLLPGRHKFMLVAHRLHSRLWRLDGNTRRVDRVYPSPPNAGETSDPGWVDGPATLAKWDKPFDLAMGLFNGSTVIYVADGLTRIRMAWFNRSNSSSDELSHVVTIAGTGRRGYKDGIGATAQFGYPISMATNAGMPGVLFVADTANHVIRKLVVGHSSWSTVVSTWVGDAAAGCVAAPRCTEAPKVYSPKRSSTGCLAVLPDWVDTQRHTRSVLRSQLFRNHSHCQGRHNVQCELLCAVRESRDHSNQRGLYAQRQLFGPDRLTSAQEGRVSYRPT
eukprot:TRINITY_DN9761_c0_g1_i3.p1 TRINITY_DN9761_c0_g1~~TRINITY_DN9761_c0_g1_i3.p1  ORF type:complete len:442 (+),score=34.86 TRINITY_DN9761_c0_g1_i3:95-1420(+)